MSNSSVPPPANDLVGCPYDVGHQILRTRIQTHIVKCRKNYRGAKKRTCPFNCTHIINDPEYEYHIETCPDKAGLVNYQNVINNKPAGELLMKSNNPEPPVLFEEFPTDEDWSDSNAKTYNPQEYVEKANVIRNKIGAQPVERRAFRRAERERLHKIDNDKT